MDSRVKQDLTDHTLLMVISTKLDNLIEKIEKMEIRLDNKVDLVTFENRFDSHEKYLKNLDDRIVEERKHREDIKEEIAYSKGEAKMSGSIWGALSGLGMGIIAYLVEHSILK